MRAEESQEGPTTHTPGDPGAADGPATVHFETGKVVAAVQDRPYDANYRLFEKAGLLKIGKDDEHFTPVELTPAGEKLLAEIPGVTNTKDAKGNSVAHVVAFAERKLIGAPKVTMMGIGHAVAEFTWAWEPNKMGELLDASGPLVKSFSMWDRAAAAIRYPLSGLQGT